MITELAELIEEMSDWEATDRLEDALDDFALNYGSREDAADAVLKNAVEERQLVKCLEEDPIGFLDGLEVGSEDLKVMIQDLNDHIMDCLDVAGRLLG